MEFWLTGSVQGTLFGYRLFCLLICTFPASLVRCPLLGLPWKLAAGPESDAGSRLRLIIQRDFAMTFMNVLEHPCVAYSVEGCGVGQVDEARDREEGPGHAH